MNLSIIKCTTFLANSWLIFLAFGTFVQAQDTTNYTGPIIDMHLHAEGDLPQYSWEEALEGLEKHNVVLSMLSVRDRKIFERYKDSSDLFWSGPLFPCYEGHHPRMVPCFSETDGWPNIQWLRDQYESGQMQVMGEIIYVYYGIPPTDKRLTPYWTLAEQLDIPVAVHTGRGPPPEKRIKGCCPNFDDDLGDPLLLKPILERHPDLRIYLMHAPGWDYVDEAIELMKTYSNVYAEMASVNSIMSNAMHDSALKAAFDAGVGKRIMFGTDNVPHDLIIKRIEDASFLTKQQKADIFYNNAARFLGLSEEEIARHHENIKCRDQ